ncbi:hypothetical protein AciPR4_0299 [Terriglobus saanensis SP1PR4]|uniref:Uncharacterized protein n=2 Tax=Terriglobus saanensis TaxID=870903 RepID=E8V0S3_TERSS|nr:hypothetical protein AciPR4_0299 [Terriglobus saanensis SP1PR4]
MRWLWVFCLWGAEVAMAEPLPVRHVQGSMQKTLVVRSETGAVIAQGALQQVAHGTDMSLHLVYTFRDGSVDDESTEFSQRGVFRLVRDRHVQKGSYFFRPIDVSEEMATGIVTIRDKDGRAETIHSQLPEDLANGLLGTLLLNAKEGGPAFRVSYLAPVRKGRLVKLAMTSDGAGDFRMAGMKKTAHIFRVKAELGGITSMVASAAGMRPADTRVWIVEGDSPELVRIQGQMYVGGPLVSIELAGTTFSP